MTRAMAVIAVTLYPLSVLLLLCIFGVAIRNCHLHFWVVVVALVVVAAAALAAAVVVVLLVVLKVVKVVVG